MYGKINIFLKFEWKELQRQKSPSSRSINGLLAADKSFKITVLDSY